MTFKQFKIKHNNHFRDTELYCYVYRITNTVINKHYYGARVSRRHPKEDLGIFYFSSSSDKEFKQDQKDNPQDYKYKVVRICKTNTEKIFLESYLHFKFNVKKNVWFYNKANQTPNGFEFTGIKNNLSLKSKLKKDESFQKWRNTLTEEDKYTIRKNVSIGTKNAMSLISKEKKEEMIIKVLANRHHKEAGKSISKTLNNRTQEEIDIMIIKAKQTRLINHGDETFNNQKLRRETMKRNWDNKSDKEKTDFKNMCSDKISKSKQGRKHHMTKKLVVFNSDDEPLYYFFGDAVKRCIELKLPYDRLIKTSKDNTCISFHNNYSKENARRNNQLHFEGWYMRKVEYVN